MTGDQIYKRALRLAHTNQEDYTSTQASEDMELRHQDLVDRIVVISKGDYFWDKGQANTVVNQSEYLAEKLGMAPDDLDIKKINKVFIKYKDTDEYPTQVEYVSPNTLDKHPDYYKINQSKNKPFFYIQDTSIFVYPAPQEVVMGGIEIFCIHKPAEIDTTSTESAIEIPTQFHKLITTGLTADIYYGQGKINEAQAMEAKYESGIRDMVNFMKSRYNTPKKRTFTDLNQFR